ncbi:hypothetical protein [Burkholderia sp. BCC1644]|uniref:hypothetical protein n=1 Tax=Burkholderia sp. BCC1644 TaxID=2676293 RepID=UPI00159150B3|nr:hypothetical protein [Burkholderia sp. BCC1644]
MLPVRTFTKNAGFDVSLAQRLKRSIAIRDAGEDSVTPATGVSLVNSQSPDLRTASGGYRTVNVNVNGNTRVGLPFQSFSQVHERVNEGRQAKPSSLALNAGARVAAGTMIRMH